MSFALALAPAALLLASTAQTTGSDIIPVVDSISVTGAPWIETDDLLRGSRLEEGKSLLEITQREVYDTILSNLQGMGYLEAGVSVEWPGWNTDEGVIGIVVTPGRKSLLGGIVFQGVSIFEPYVLGRQAAVEQGDEITPAGLSRTRERILDLYRRRGYATAAVETRLLPFVEDGPDSIPGLRAIEIAVVEGEQIMMGSVHVDGLETVRKKVVVREIRLERGDSLDSEMLRRSIASIYGLGLFQDVRFSYEGLEEGRDTVDLFISLSERPYRQLDLGAGYASPSALLLSAYWKHPNIFDNNQRLTAGASYTHYLGSGGGDVIEPEVVYEEPWLASTRWRGRLRFFYYFLEMPSQEERKYGAEATLLRDLTEHLQMSLGYGLERDRFYSATPEGGEESYDWIISSRLTASLAHDTRDAVLDPRTGHLLRGEGRVSGGILGGSSYYHLESEVRVFKPVIRDVILGWRFKAGIVMPYGSDSTIAPSARFYLGGGSTVRGYGFNALGPEDEEGNPLGGRVVLLANVETRTRIWGNLGFALFADAGGLWQTPEEIATLSTGFGVGMGLRFSTPFGPLRVDYGFAPTWSDGLRRGRAYVALGHPF
jgi:outer membrane protein insertion porin family